MARHPLNFRGGHATRLEALTDAVFGFAITLLVVWPLIVESIEEGLLNPQSKAADRTHEYATEVQHGALQL